MRQIKRIFVHCTAGSQRQTIDDLKAEFHRKGWSNPGYHYVIDTNGGVHQQPAVHRLDSELDQPGTYVLMKSGRKMNQVKEILERSGREVRMVENCGMPDEHIYNSVEEIPDDAGYYSLIIAKEKAEEK